MSWTDERVEQLKRLWMEGLSASQIAAQLGEGVTRNAVIGKVHRLKLSARAKPATSTPHQRSVNRTPRRSVSSSSPSSASSVSGSVRRRLMNAAPVVGATALKASEDVETQALQVVETQADSATPEPRRVSLLSLNENTCKWPLGDPLSKDFSFCGRESEEGKPYCEFHSRKAYHTIDRKKH